MAYGCPICSGSLEKLPDEELRDAGGALISAAPCGHVFHRVCINKWFQGTLANSSKCPCCRKDIPKLRCIPLFPTLHDDSILDDSINRIPCDHEPIIRELKNNVDQLKVDTSVLQTINANTTSELQTVRSKLLIEERKAQKYIEKYTEVKSILSHEGEVQKKLDKANSELACLKSLRDALEAVKSDRELEADEIQWPVTQHSIDNLLSMKLTLTRELRSQMQIIKNKEADKERIRSENSKLRAELRQIKKKHEEVVDENANLKIEIEDLQGQLIENGIEHTSEAADASIMYLTPKKKRKSVQVPQLMSNNQDDSVIEIPPPDVDQDVDLLEPFHNRKIKSNKSPINQRRKHILPQSGVKSTNDTSTRNPSSTNFNNQSSNSIKSTLDKDQQSSSNAAATTASSSNNNILSQQVQNKSKKTLTSHTKEGPGLSILKRKKLHGSTKSADDVLNVAKSSSSSSSGITKNASSNSLSTLKEHVSSYDDLSPIDFRANIKSSWPGLTDTPIGIAASSRLNPVVGRGISRPPKVIKK